MKPLQAGFNESASTRIWGRFSPSPDTLLPRIRVTSSPMGASRAKLIVEYFWRSAEAGGSRAGPTGTVFRWNISLPGCASRGSPALP